jgi:beta-lactamase class D
MNARPLILSIALSTISFTACSSQPLRINQYSQSVRGCFILMDLKTGKIVEKIGEEFCSERVFACSTFKVPLALMAFDRGVLQSEESGLKWDGKDRGIESWNKDQTAKTWISNSVVWFSQRITLVLGMEAMKKYLAKFQYGNEDMGGGLTNAWLSSTLKISADEQIGFWRRFWVGDLSVSSKAIEITKSLVFLEKTDSGSELYGKTGSGFGPGFRIGWFAGYIQKRGKQYVFALDFRDSSQPLAKGFAGQEAKAKAKAILTELGLL